MVLAVILVSAAGAEIQLCSAVGAVEKAGEYAGSSCFCRPAFVLPQFLHPFPLSLLNDGGLGVLSREKMSNSLTVSEITWLCTVTKRFSRQKYKSPS